MTTYNLLVRTGIAYVAAITLLATVATILS